MRYRIAPTRNEGLAIIASSALFAVAFPPFPFFVPAFLCLVPIAVVIARIADGGGSGREAARVGAWFGFLGYACNLYWIAVALSIYTKLAILGYIGALIWLTPFVAAAGAALFVARRRTGLPLAVLLPVVWVALEVVLNHLSDLSFPWLPLGLAMGHVPVMAQIADVSGVRLVSFWIALINGLVADAWMLRRSRSAVALRAGAIVLAAAVVAAYGVWRLRTTRLVPVARVAIVQPNIPQDEKWEAQNQGRTLLILDSLTRKVLEDDHPALVLWPEAALPGFMYMHPEWQDSVRALARSTRTPLLFGVLDVVFHSATNYDIYNAAMLADTTGRYTDQPPYYKSYLVPVVERVPFLPPKWFSKLDFFGGYGIGRNTAPFVLPFGKVGVLICYESIFPQRSRLYRREGATILVNITNDAWFGTTIAPYQHEAHLTFRAIENRMGIVRAANTGISGYIDPLGRLHGATPLFVAADRTYLAQSTRVTTLYTRFGDWAGGVCLALTAMLLLTDYVERRRSRHG